MATAIWELRMVSRRISSLSKEFFRYSPDHQVIAFLQKNRAVGVVECFLGFLDNQLEQSVQIEFGPDLQAHAGD
jgi:hypothetical protein